MPIDFRYRILILFCAFSNLCLQAQTAKKASLSAGARHFLYKQNKLENKEQAIFPENVYRKDAGGRLYINCIMQVQPDFNDRLLQNLGIHSGTRAGNIRTVQVPLHLFDKFIGIPGISYIDTDQPMVMEMDSARKKTRVDSVHAGIWLPQSFQGDGVVMGIIDAGFDYTHPAFYDTGYHHYRVKRVWEQKSIGIPPAGFAFGSELSDSASIINKAYDIYTGTHGTHVAGIAAGSGFINGNNRRYRGVAYKSELAFVAIYPAADHWLNSGLTDMLDGINYLFTYGNSVGKPVVANLSWGGPIGPRDGKSLFSQALDNLTGLGKIFTVSAGNNGSNNIHIQKTFTAQDTLLQTFASFSSSLADKRNLIDIWGDSGTVFCLRLRLFSGFTSTDSTLYYCPDDTTRSLFLKGSDGDTLFITLTTVVQEYNGKPHMLLELQSNTTDRLNLGIRCSSGRVNMWQGFVLQTSGYYGAFTAYNYPWASAGDAQLTTSDLVSSRNALGVGAYNSKVKFTNVSGTTLTYTGYANNALATFSSRGPTADGRIKPDITGPGLALASSVSSWDSGYAAGGPDYSSVVANYLSPLTNRSYPYAMAAGTSMSSPAVAGISALLLQANENLDPAQLKTVLFNTAILDQQTGSIGTSGNTNWGHGKVNAWKALVQVLQAQGINYMRHSQINCLFYPNPGNGLFTLELEEEPVNQLQISVSDITGRITPTTAQVMRTGTGLYALDFESLAAGTYLLHVYSSTAETHLRFVKY